MAALRKRSKKPEVFNSSVEMVTPRSKMQKSTQLPSKKKVCAIIRRSDRLRNVTPPAQKQEIEPVVEEINLCESEKEDEPHVEETPPESMSPEQSLEEEGDYSKAAKRHLQNDRPKANLKYKRLYFDSQKKIEALTKENYELSKNLAVALGKLEAKEEAVRIFKDLLLISNVGKANETARNLSSQAERCRCSSPSDIGDPKAVVKRKKIDR